MPSLGTYQTPWVRIQRLLNAQQQGLQSLTESMAGMVDLEARQRVSERPWTPPVSEWMPQRDEAAALGPQMPRVGTPAFTPTPARPGTTTMGELYAEGRRPLEAGERVVSPFTYEPQGPQPMTILEALDRPRQVMKEELIAPVVPDFELPTIPGEAVRAALPPGAREAAGAVEALGGPGVPDVTVTDEMVEEAASWILDPYNILPVVGFGPDLLRAAKAGRPALRALLKNPQARSFLDDAIRAGERGGPKVPGGKQLDDARRVLKEHADLGIMPPARMEKELRAIEKELTARAGPRGEPRNYLGTATGELEAKAQALRERIAMLGVGPEDVARVTPEQPKLPGFEDPHVVRADPGPPPPRGPTRPRGPTPDDPEFRDIQEVALKGEQPEETLVRRHQGAIDTEKRLAAIEVREGNQMLKEVGLGRTFRGSVVAREEGAFNELNSLLHNPGKVASGERVVPDELRPIYDRLRAGTDWEQAARVDFDPDMALVEDYFYRGWQPPEGMFTGEARGALGRSPAFRLPRVNATYDEMVEAGFKPLFENPAEQMRYSRMMGVRYREQMNLIEQIKAKELALPDVGGAVPDGWRVPRVGPAFEGKPYANGNQVAFTRRWAVPDSLANRLENAYGKTPNLGKGEIFGKTIDFQAAVDAAVFMPKRAKLIGSVFQHVDFLGRSHVGAWTGFVDALRRGHPIESVYHLLKWPKSATGIIHATLSPGYRAKLARLAVDDTPLFAGRRLSNRMISEAGLSLRDETILPELDQVIRQVAEEGRAARWGKAPLRLLGDLERAWRKGLFEGVYPAAILTDVKNNIAPAIVRQHPRATDEQLAGMIAKAANASYSTIPAATSVVQNQQARWFLTRFLFSMAENEGLLRAFTGAIRGENAAYFRVRLLGTYLGVITLANAIHFASTGEPLPFSRYAPISKDRWGPLPVGYNSEFASPTIPLTGRSGTEITLDLMGQMDTAFRVLDPRSFLNARMSVPARAGLNQATGKDFFGAPIDTVGPGGIFSRTAQLVQDLFAPIGPGQAGLEALRSNIEETEGLIQPGEDRLGSAGIGVQATGVNLRAETTPQLLDRIRADVMREKGIEGSYESIKATDSPLANEIDNEVEVRIGQELELRRETAELRGQTTPQSQFFEEQEVSRGQQNEEQLAADTKLDSGQWQGDVWREDFRDRQRAFFNQREGLKQAFKIEFEDKEAPSGSVNAAIETYFDVNIDDYLQDDGTTDWDGFFGAQDAALAPLSPKDKKRVMDFIRQYDTPTVTEFRKAQEVVDKFYETPKYVGLNVGQGEEVDRILYDLAPALQTRFEAETGEKLSRRDAVRHLSAIIRDKKAREFLLEHFGGGVQAGLRHIGGGGGLRLITDARRETDEIRNEKRDQILIDNERQLARFYPDLLERELSREQEAGLLPTTLEALFGPGMALPDVERRGLRLITAR